MTPSTRERRRERSRRELAAIAVDLFEKKGFAATTVEEIAAAADYTPRTFFRQFASKEDVVFYDIPDILLPLEALVDPDAKSQPAWAAVRAVVTENARRWEEAGPKLARTRTRMFHEEPALYRRFLEICSEWEAVVARVFAAERGTDAATDTHAQASATAVIGACRTSFRVWLNGADGTIAEHLERALDALEDGLAAPTSSRRG